MNPDRLRELLAYEPTTGVFTWRVRRGGPTRVGSVAGHINPRGYREIKLDYVLYLAHRLAWMYVHGEWPRAALDHVNGARDDNRLSNLRECVDGIVNQHNLHKPRSDNTSGATGVSWHKQSKQWNAQLRVAGRRKHIGLFATKEEASAAYVSAKRLYHKGCTL